MLGWEYVWVEDFFHYDGVDRFGLIRRLVAYRVQ